MYTNSSSWTLLYAVYLPLSIGIFLSIAAMVTLRKEKDRERLGLIIGLIAPLVTVAFGLVVTMGANIFMIAAIGPALKQIWFFVVLPASICLGILLAIFARKFSDLHKDPHKPRH